MLKKTILMGKNVINVMGLPLYEWPKLSCLFKRVWQRTRSFIVGAGKTIIVVVCVLNFFNSLGTDGEFGHHDTQDSLLSKSAQVLIPLFASMGAIKNEVGTRWSMLNAIWSFTLVYLSAAACYQLAVFSSQPVHSFISIVVIMAVFFSIYYALKRAGKNILTVPTLVSYR